MIPPKDMKKGAPKGRSRVPSLARKVAARLGFPQEPDQTKFQHLGLADYQVYPFHNKLVPPFVARRGKLDGTGFILERSTAVASMGSCFAREIKFFLIKHGYNYVQTEFNPWSMHSSCAWERVYSPVNALQIFQYTKTGDISPNRLLEHRGGVFDLWRNKIKYSDRLTATEDIARHIACSRQAIEQAELFVMTVGQNEVWHHRGAGFWFAKRPPSGSFPKEDLELRQLSIDENVETLTCCYRTLKAINPRIKLILTLSPVPSEATFFDCNVVVRSSLNKAILRVALAKFFELGLPDVQYFPSYEIVQTWRGNPFTADNIHVRPKVVGEIMNAFLRSTSR